MKILFVTEKRVDAGSIQAVANYVRAGTALGHVIALYGRPDPRFPQVHFSRDLDAFDFVLFIIESGLHWMSGLRMPRLLASVPRDRRAVLDADGMYNEVISIDGYDRNHANDEERSRWLAHLDLLADRIMQPTMEPRDPKVSALPFYGYDPAARADLHGSPEKYFDIVQVAHNWWRGREVSTRLLPAIEEIRTKLDSICFVGSWWDGAPPPFISNPSLKQAFAIDGDRLRRLRIQVCPSVPYTEVIRTMSQGRINIMTQRPLLRRLKLLTSKYFEIFCADTVPLVMLNPAAAEAVYGPAGRELALHDNIAEKLLDVLDRPRKYRELVEEVRHHLDTHHSYEKRVQQLVEALNSTPAV